MRVRASTKILLATLVACLLTVAAGVAFLAHFSYQTRVARLHAEMRGILERAEVVRDELGRLYEVGVIDVSALHRRALEQAAARPLDSVYRETDLYRAIPVVASWEAARLAAEARGFRFVISSAPGIAPRHRENDHTAEYRAAFEAFARGEKEYLNVDPDTATVTLARPVFLSASCLACHGSPASSPTGDGRESDNRWRISRRAICEEHSSSPLTRPISQQSRELCATSCSSRPWLRSSCSPDSGCISDAV